MAFVLDASVTMRWLTKDGTIADLAYANFILDKFLEPNMHVHVPSHWPLKLAPVMVDLATGVHAFDETLAIAREHRLTPYDAAYLELALRLSAPLATLDKDLRRAAEQAGVILA